MIGFYDSRNINGNAITGTSFLNLSSFLLGKLILNENYRLENLSILPQLTSDLRSADSLYIQKDHQKCRLTSCLLLAFYKF